MKNAFSLRATHNLTSFITLDAGADYTSIDGENPPAAGPEQLHLDLPAQLRHRNTGCSAAIHQPAGRRSKVYDANETNFVPGADYWFRIFENDYLQDEQMFRGRLTVTATLSKWLRLQLERNFSNISIKNESKELGQGFNFTGSDNASGGFYSLSHAVKKSYFLKWMGLVTKQLTKDAFR